MNRKMIKLWVEERDKVVKSYDVKAFKEFYYKWKRRGLYTMDLPADDVIEISLRKMVCMMKSATDEEQAEAKNWLIAHGSSPEVF